MNCHGVSIGFSNNCNHFKCFIFVNREILTFAGNGYIPTSALKEILHELDAKLTDPELNGIIDEIDEDGSGTVDFDGKPLHFVLQFASYIVAND